MSLTKEQQAVLKYTVNIVNSDSELVDQIYVVETEDDTIHFDGLDCHSLEWLKEVESNFMECIGIDVANIIKQDIKQGRK